MRLAIIGAGAMGSVFGAHLSEAGHDVAFVDVSRDVVDALQRDGLQVLDRRGSARTVRVRATAEPSGIGPVDLVLVFVKCYHTEAAVHAAAPLLGPHTAVLSLQNGWGNAARIAAIVGEERLLVGVTYHSATVLEPGRVAHAGEGPTFLGRLDGAVDARAAEVAGAFAQAGLPTIATPDVLTQIWAKLALNVCTLPTSALLRLSAGELVRQENALALMRALLREAVWVARARGIALDEEERWEAITGLLRRAAGAKASMLQDVENRRRTEIDVINGAVVSEGRRLGVPTPHNQTMAWLVRALEGTFGA
jgi:2-dehydropantoate 2-reductase